MLPSGFIVFAIILRFMAGASYFKATWQGKARPNLVSWSLWSLTALLAFGIQLLQGAGTSALITLAIGVSPIAVCIAALHRHTYAKTFSRLDKYCMVLTVAGLLLWLASKDPLTVLLMGIVADLFSNIPTVKKAYQAPHTEHATAYCLSALSMLVALLTIQDWQLTSWLFTAYILCINIVIFLVITLGNKLTLPGLLQQKQNA
ncbi:MAG TPA: hypothetical protein VFT16_02740 [Candidatus Saccharimonadales bacterium]|nr:hypothetical protein [Candidatus Saccharimonadales bacterium]